MIKSCSTIIREQNCNFRDSCIKAFPFGDTIAGGAQYAER